MGTGLLRRFASIAAFGLAACGGMQPSAVVSGADAPDFTRPSVRQLVYVSEFAAGDVGVYPYAEDRRLQSLVDYKSPGDLCVDSEQHVYVTGGYSFYIGEYRYGDVKPIKLLADSIGFPSACSIDPTTGDLAVVNGVSLDKGQKYGVLIYRHAKGLPKLYTDPSIPYFYFCGYDAKGNLFVDGENATFEQTELAVLPRGSKTFRNIKTDQLIASPGDIRWDGKYLAVGDERENAIYRFAITDGRAHLRGTVQLQDASDVLSFWIDGSTVVGADYGTNQIDYWKYPDGGKPVHTTTGITTPQGVAVLHHPSAMQVDAR